MSEGPDDETLRSLAERCVMTGGDKGLTFVTAESCTGGLLAHLITDVPGTSAAYLGGWVVYHNRRKSEDLEVDRRLIDREGAVSQAVAKALADGARRRAGATFGIATTGIAGPTGGSPGKPVGTIWLGLATPDVVHAVHHVSPANDRHGNKRAFAARALDLLALAIDAYPEAPVLPGETA